MGFHCHSLGVGFLQQGAPKLPGRGRAAKEQHAVPADRQTVIYDDVHPTAEAPEPEMEDSRIQVRAFRVPVLFHVVWDDLGGRARGEEWEMREEEGTKGRSKEQQAPDTQPSSIETARTPGRKWQPSSSSYPDCLGAGHEC